MNQTTLTTNQADTFYITGGNVPADALSYVTRDADHRLLQCLLQSQFCYILTSRQMGKSSLMTMVAGVSELKLSGIVQAVSGRLVVRNRMYAQVFDRAWIRENMPGAELRRQRVAYRRGL